MYPRLRPVWVTAQGLDIGHRQRDLFEAALAPPRNAANLHWIHEVRRLAKEDGSDVVLTGAFGNMSFSYDGTGYVPELLGRGRLGRLAKELWHSGPAARVLRRAVSQALLPHLPRHLQSRILSRHDGRILDPLRSWSPIAAGYATERQVAERAEAMCFDPQFLPIRSVNEYRRRMLDGAATEAGDIMYGLDRVHALPTRDPTRYRPLVEFCFAIPADQYLRNGTRRWLARRLLRGKVPEMVLQERRRGQQAADWPSRVRPRRAEILDELDLLSGDPDIAARIDIARLRKAVETMPEDDAAISAEQASTLHLALSRGLTTARFIRYLKGHNDI
jgi:asparagine synthase (glutamine-hydrolysing)